MWDVDHVQFTRLLDEINAAGLTENQVKTVAASMDLQPSEVKELLNRASARWDDLKPLLLKKTPLTEDQVSEELAEDGKVQAVVTMDFEELVGHLEDAAVESVFDALAERVAGEVSLSNVEYKVLFNDGDTLYMRVTAKADDLDDADEEEEEEDVETV